MSSTYLGPRRNGWQRPVAVPDDLSALHGPTTGRVRLAGDDWSAMPFDETMTIPVGETVEILSIKGATAYVHPVARLES